MSTQDFRLMRPDDWTPVRLAPGRYGNAQPLRGYRRADGTGGNPLYPATPGDSFEARLAETMRTVRRNFPAVTTARFHVRMPYRPPDETRLPHTYQLTDAPRRLSTTSVSVILVPRQEIRAASTGFCFRGTHLPPLRRRLRGTPFHGLIGNLGYYMTAELLSGKFPWSHNERYPRHPLPAVYGHIGFHLHRNEAGASESGILGAHPAAVAVRDDGQVAIIPRLTISGYRITIGAHTFPVRAINDPQAQAEAQLFTPGLWTAEIAAHEADWQTYAPYLPLHGRTNLFLANEGDGRHPQEKVIAVWDAPVPLPAFGAVLSLAPHLMSRAEAQRHIGERVHIQPAGGSDLSRYTQLLGGLVPLVDERGHRYLVRTRQQLLSRLREDGATSPLSRSGRESDNFAPGIREPAGVLLQTDERIGWVLCDGRHELSIGADVSDVAHIVHLLEQEGAFGGPVRAAVFLDGGSAMKTYAVRNDGRRPILHLLNRVAAGARNGPGEDEDGLNLYSVLRLALKTIAER